VEEKGEGLRKAGEMSLSNESDSFKKGEKK
jgi:hypothetical protein